jgi:hypothetical protein
MKQNQQPLFDLGYCVATRGAVKAMQRCLQTPYEFLKPHVRGNWGVVPPEDWERNTLALVEGYRLISAYRTNDGTKLWVITEADRAVTTILLPDEY